MKKQTAVDLAIDLINKDFEVNGRLRFAYVFKILNEAKEMEKQQIIDAIIFFKERPHLEINAEQYYNETYFNETFKNK
jgi:hypothetical protein